MGRGKGETRYSCGWGKAGDKKGMTRVARVAKQNFQQIKAECLAKGCLWEDPDFPATGSSVYYSTPTNFQWMRPKEVASDPQMFVGGASRFDVKQGDLGNCWFLAAVASLCATKNNDLLHQVVPLDNCLGGADYCGAVHFQLWQYGQWVDVVVDDRLPTNGGSLMFMHSVDANEFWSALLEKAYAKLNGSYEALQGGSSAEAMEDFTGGIVETFNFKKEVPANLFKVMKKAHERYSMMGCTIDALPGQIESVLGNGLVMGHAYSITSIKQIDYCGQKVGLVRVRNPWGNQYEWKGAWADSGAEWQHVSAAQKQELGLSKDDDGEFWMSYEDFVTNFHKLEICNLSPESYGNEPGARKRWEATFEDGQWKSRVNAGGCRNFLETFWTNPQYRVEVVDADEDDDEDVGTLIIGLMQKERRKKRAAGIGDHLTIGYMIYKIKDAKMLEPNAGPLDLNFFKFNAAVARSPVFSNMREVCGRHRMAPGHYCVIPCTFKPNEEADFLLRVFSEKPTPSKEIDEETGFIAEQPEGPRQYSIHLPGNLSHLFDQHQQLLSTFNMDLKLGGFQQQQQRQIITTSRGGGMTIKVQAAAEQRRRRAQQVTEEDVMEEKRVRQIFKETSGEDLEVDAYELRTILDENFKKDMKLRPRFKFDGFSLETCRSLVAMKDADHSGKLGYDEFKQLWADLRAWKKVFKEFDADESGYMNSHELRQALNSVGYRVSNSTFNCLVMRYSGPQGRIYFDDFMLCAARLKTMFETFKETSKGQFSLDQFVQTTMYS